MALSEQYPLFFANADHVLIIAESQPDGMTEMTDEFIPFLKQDDWEWIGDASRKIIDEEARKYATTLEAEQNKFADRFEAELKKARAEVLAHGRAEDDPTE